MIDINLLLEKGATYRHTEASEIIFNAGAPATFYYQLVSGRVRWSHFDDNGKEVLHKIVEAGEAFGEFRRQRVLGSPHRVNLIERQIRAAAGKLGGGEFVKVVNLLLGQHEASRPLVGTFPKMNSCHQL